MRTRACRRSALSVHVHTGQGVTSGIDQAQVCQHPAQAAGVPMTGNADKVAYFTFTSTCCCRRAQRASASCLSVSSCRCSLLCAAMHRSSCCFRVRTRCRMSCIWWRCVLVSAAEGCQDEDLAAAA